MVPGILIRSYRGPDDDSALDAMPQPRGSVGLLRPGDRGWVAEVGGAVAGFARIDHWDEADGTRLYLLSGFVDPAFRGLGVGRTLLAHQEEEAAAHWHAFPGIGPALLGGNADQNHPDILALLLAAGYRSRFTLVDLARNLTHDQTGHPAGDLRGDPGGNLGSDLAGDRGGDPGSDPAGDRGGDPTGDPAGDTGGDPGRDLTGALEVALPAGLALRPVREQDQPHIHRTLRICFADAGHGQHTQSYRDYLDDVRDVELWLIAWDGDEVAAVLINERKADGSVDTPWVAVLPGWRRRGVARALLQRSLRLLADHGIKEATIRTVQENTNHTVTRYEQAGYRVTARHPRYAKPL